MVWLQGLAGPRMEANKIEITTLLLSLAAVLSIEWAARVVISNTLSHPMVILGCARLLQILLVILIVLTRGQGLSSIGLARSEMASGLKKGLIWSAGFAAITSIAGVALFAANINPLILIRTRLPTQTSDLILFFIVGGMVGPVAEELLFRGILYGFLRRWGVMVALILSTLIFVVSHPIDLGVSVTRVVGGILFAVAYEIGGSLLVPITIHGLGNLAIFTLSLIP